MRIHEHRCMAGLSSGLAIAALALLLASATGCGGSTTTPTNGGSTPQASPSVAAAPERLVGSDSVAVTQKVVDLARAALHAPTVAKLVRPYAREAVVDDFSYNLHFQGRAEGAKAFRKNLAEYTGARWTAGHAGRGWAAVIWGATASLGAAGDGATVLEIRDGKIARETLYYNSSNMPF
ncbi:MAG: hypothetical protein NTW58_04585 [Actinobacteria bacterium]|nr:hypothetical protein [Actinomycetota bacterium]